MTKNETLAFVSAVLLLGGIGAFAQTPSPTPPRAECNGLTGPDLAKCISDTPGSRNIPAERNRTNSEDARRKGSPLAAPTGPDIVQPPGSPPGITVPKPSATPPAAPSR